MAVYVDLVFLFNCLADAAALYITARLSGLPVRRHRILAAALAGGTYGALCALPGLAPAASPLPQMAAAAGLVWLCFGRRRDFLRQLLLFFLLSCTMGGALVAVCRLAEEGGALTGENPAVRRAMRDAWACSVSYKHPSFSTEYETRLVVSPFEKEDFGVQPCYHVTKERIKKYYPLDLRAMCREIGIGMEDLVAEIIIGPDSTQSLAIFQDYLRDNGLSPLAERVSLSDCPLRGLAP